MDIVQGVSVLYAPDALHRSDQRQPTSFCMSQGSILRMAHRNFEFDDPCTTEFQGQPGQGATRPPKLTKYHVILEHPTLTLLLVSPR